MGIFSSCFHVPDEENDAGSNDSSSNICLCPKCFFRRLMTKHRNTFNQEQSTSATSLPHQQSSSANSQLIPHDHVDANHGNDGAERQEKGTRRVRVQPETVGQSEIQLNLKSLEGNKTLISFERISESSTKVLSLDDEDVCPTCFEDYTEENPKIVAKCSHHYHLGCIYEWMERSKNCPACGKLMLFDESS